VNLIVLDADGLPLGTLPPFDIPTPWWQEAGEIVEAVRDRYALDLQVLRVLHGRAAPPGGDVTYLAQTDGLAATIPPGLLQPIVEPDAGVAAALRDEAQRAPYARPGGPAATLRWANAAVQGLGRGPVIRSDQQRTWNLSAIWRLTTPDSPLWIKEVPSFFAHEPAVLSWLARTPSAAHTPVLLASDRGRMLMEDIAGEDRYGAPDEARDQIAATFHPVQVRAVSHVDELLAAGVPDRRTAALVPLLAEVVAAGWYRDPALDALIDGLPDRMAAVAACGLPETLCHGDLHPGNVRGGGGHPDVIMDWGDSYIGHPAFDILRLVEGAAAPGHLVQAWASRWRATVPGCDPERAVDLLGPVAAVRNAAVYAAFLAQIEPSEYPYHADDPAHWLRIAAAGA
jgi:hypothetical protein